MQHQRKKPSTHVCALIGATLLLAVPAAIYADGANSTAPNHRAVLFSLGQTQQAAGDSVAELTAKGYTAINYQADKTATSGSIGYRHPLANHWSVDTQYLNQGEAKPNLTATLPAGKSNAQAAQDMAESLPKRGQGISVAALHHHAHNGNWTSHLGGGAFLWHSERKITVNGTSHTSNRDGISPLVQAGLGYRITPRASLEGTLQHTFMPDEAVTQLSVGLVIGF
ncbi:MAG: hypothetical protein JG718_00295 [Candidatus Thiothrix moscowensis]|nr:hypothetical protein [Candidatus Thiothrix moscowensis]